MKLLVLIIAILLIPFGYSICDYVYLDQINQFSQTHPLVAMQDNPYHVKWWMLRMDIMVLIAALAMLSHRLRSNAHTEKYFQFFVYIGIALTISDIIDRWFFNIRVFTWTDIAMIIVVLVMGYLKHIRKEKRITFE